MTSFVALLRAVNVGGTGKLPMEDLRSLCTDAGFAKVQTYIASGNVVFTCRKSETQVKAMLEASLAEYAGKKIGVFVRTAAEMADVSASNPFRNGAEHEHRRQARRIGSPALSALPQVPCALRPFLGWRFAPNKA
jgi:uncharacterized protein (DUF1697 family)